MDIDNDEPENSDKSSCSSSSSSVFENDSDVDLDCDPSICSLCEATDRPTTDIGDCEELKSIKQYIESTSSKVKEVRFVCQTCLYKLYTVIDQNRLKACRQMRGVHLGSDSVSSKSSEEPGPSTSDCTVNETPAQSHTFDANEMFAPRNLSPETIGTEKHPSEGIDDSLGDPRIVTEHPVVNEQFNESSLCIDAHEAIDTDNENDDSMEKQTNNDEANTAADAIPSSQTSSHSHLDVMYEQTESALATESGGTLEQYKTPPLQCCFCTKEFVLQKAYNKHMRTHHSRLLSTRSGSSSRGRSTPHNAVHECVDCSATFDSSTKLKTHSRIHLKRYYCMYCHKESLSQFDHDFHEAECRGGHMAKDESVETTGRMTRSRARSLRSARNPNATDDGKSEKSAVSKPVSKRSRSRKSIGGKTRNGDGDGEDDDDDAATSVAYTDYTQINRDVAKWVAGTCFSNIGSKASSVKSLNISECNTDVDLENISDAENMPQNIVSHKEYDIIMLERLIHQTESNVYICSYLDCDHLTNTLREMCLHEILIHKLKPHFYCRKCKGVFTSKLYLDYHLHLQNYGEYQCNKCSMRFNFEYLLQYHLIQHQKNNSFPCLLCGNSFMSTQELRIHCIETGHDPKKRKKLITIDPTMSIANDVAAEAPPPKRTYKSTINIMNLPKTPSLQPRINMKRPKGRSIFLGEIDFVYQLGLNCVRTK